MPTPDSTDDLTAIVQSGASRPLRKRLLIALLLAAAGGGGYYYFTRNGGQEDKPEYVTESVVRGRITLIVTAAGSLTPTNQVVIGSELSGTLQEVYVDSNDPVKKGQPLAKLDPSKLNQQTERSKASLLAAKARVSLANATLKETQAALARQQELHDLSGGKTPSRATMATSEATVARAEAELESANAAVAGAKADVLSFERDLEKTLIRSPVDGVVLARTIEVGQTVAASFTAPTLFTIAEDLKKMELLVSVTEADIGRVTAGQAATFTVDAWPARTYTATVKKVAFGSGATSTTGGTAGGNNNQAATGGVVTYSTELDVANDDQSLRPGMTATVDISITDKSDIIVVPNTALRFDPVVAAAIANPLDTTKRTFLQKLTPGGGRRMRGGSQPSPPRSSSAEKGPRVWVLQAGEPVEVSVTPGITDGKLTEITGDSLTPDAQVIVSLKPVEKT